MPRRGENPLARNLFGLRQSQLMRYSPVNLPLLVLGLASIVLGRIPAARAEEPVPPALKYRVIRQIPLKGDTGWDYLTVDDKARRLYVTRGSFVSVHDADTGEVVGEIADTPGVHGVAVAPAHDHGFISNGRDNSVTVFNLKTLAVVTKLKAGENPDAIVYEPVTHRVFAFNGRSKNATVIDAERNTLAGEFAVGGRPEFAVADGKGAVFVDVEDTNEILRIDAKSMSVKARWPLAPGAEPTSLAIDPTTRRLFVGCSNKKMIVMDAGTGRILATLEIGAGVDAVAFDSLAGGIFSSNGVDGNLTVARMASPEKFEVVDTVETRKGARTMAFDPYTRHIFTITAQFGPPPTPTPDQPGTRPKIIPGSVVLLELAPLAEVR
jgi:DNA-binding beta-propeller fold protein YncE